MSSTDRNTGRRYRGADRRASDRVDQGEATGIAARWTLLAVGVSIVIVAVALLGQSTRSQPTAHGDLARGAVMTLALVVAVGAQLHWRITGTAAGIHLATAAWLTGASIAGEALGADQSLAGATALLVARLLSAIWVARAAAGPAVDSGDHVLRQLAAVTATGLLVWLPVWTVLEASPATVGQVVLVGRTTLAATWLAVACLALVSIRRDGSELLPWLPGMAVGLGGASLLHGLDPVVTPRLGPASAVLAVAALLVVATGICQSLAQRAASRRIALHRAQHAQQRSHDHRSLAERERTHELRNALLAIEGAVNALERHRGHLDGAQQTRLERALSNGVAHLHDLLLPDEDTTSDPSAVDAGEVVEECAELARARGLTIHVDDRATTRALVRRVALVQIIENLLANVERHTGGEDGPASTWVTIRSDAAEVRIEVADDGPGLQDDGDERVFAMRYRTGGRGQSGDGLGLPVARRLAREQGGDLVVRPTSRGACFELCLPVAVDDRTDVGDHGRQIGEPLDLGTLDDDRSPAHGVGAVVEDDDDIGGRSIGRAGGDRSVEVDRAAGSRDAGGPGIAHGDDGDVVEDDAQRVVEQRRGGRHRDVRDRRPDGGHT